MFISQVRNCFLGNLFKFKKSIFSFLCATTDSYRIQTNFCTQNDVFWYECLLYDNKWTVTTTMSVEMLVYIWDCKYMFVYCLTVIHEPKSECMMYIYESVYVVIWLHIHEQIAGWITVVLVVVVVEFTSTFETLMGYTMQ